MFSLSGKVNSQIPCFPCAVATPIVSLDVSALFTSIPVNQALDVINQLIIQHQTDMDFKYKVGKAWYEVADHLDREDVMALLRLF